MFLGDLNIFFLFFFILISTMFIGVNSALHLLLTAELLWITLYVIVLYIGLIFDNLSILSLTFFFLIFSAIEFGVGLVLLLLQHLFKRTITLSDNDTNVFKFTLRTSRRINTNRLVWKA